MSGFRFRLLLIAAFTSVLMHGAPPQVILMNGGPGNPPPNNAPRRTVTGTVVNSITGEPLRRALVQINGASALTGSDGRFQLENIPDGPIYINATKPGFFDARSLSASQWSQVNEILTVSAGKTDFRVSLSPAARIGGSVTATNGEPLENAPLTILFESIQNGRTSWQPRGFSATDDTGHYQTEELTAGRYLVVFGGLAMPGPDSKSPWLVCSPAYYPDTPDRSAAQVIELRPGEHFRLDLHFRWQRAYSISGTIAGAPAQMLSLLNADGQNIQIGGTRFDQQGRFFLAGVAPGTWTLSYEANDPKGHRFLAKQEVTVGHDDVTGVQLTPSSPVTIPVLVTHAPASVNNSSATPNQPAQPNFYAELVSKEEDFRHYPTQSQGDPPEPQFAGIPPGSYRLLLNPYINNECAESAWYGNIDLLNNDLVINQAAAAQPIRVTMLPSCPTVGIEIHGQNQQKSAFVVFIPDRPMQEPQLSMSVPGIPSTARLPPGSYQVYALADINGLEYANPEVMRSYPSQSVTLSPGQTTTIKLDLTDNRRP